MAKFYANINCCPHCQRPEKRLLIGFCNDEFAFTFYPLMPYESPDGNAVQSWARWLEVLSGPKVIIEDWNLNQYTLAAFKEMVESKPRIRDNDSFVDPQGFYFTRNL